MINQFTYKTLCMACIALAVLVLGVTFVRTALADVSASETPLEAAMRLTAALPSDPDEVLETMRPDVEEASRAYDALSDQDKATFDTTYCAELRTYGRWLESAIWGLAANTEPVDNSTTLADGDYSAYIDSSSSLGKSTSDRSKSWTVSKLTAKGGKLTAVVQCTSASNFKKMRMGGVDYTAISSSGTVGFKVPFAVNKSLKFTIDSSSIADSIACELSSTMDLSQASAAQITAAKAVAEKALQRNASKWTSKSFAAVKSAAKALSSLARKNDVTSVELQAYTVSLHNALAALKLKKSPTLNNEKESVAKKEVSKNKNSNQDSMGAETYTDASVSTSSSTKKKASSTSVEKKDMKTQNSDLVEDYAQELAINENEVSSDADGHEFPYTQITFAALFVLLLLLGTALRTILFLRQLNNKEGSL